MTVSHGLLISSGKLGRATAAPFLLPHPCTSSAERATFPRRHRGGPGPSAAAHQGCLWGDTGGAGPASLLGVPRAHSPRVRIPAASWGPATGVSRRGVQAGSSGHVSHHPHSQQVCAAPQIIWCRFLLPPGRGINGGMRKSWVISPKGREQCGTDKNVCRV